MKYVTLSILFVFVFGCSAKFPTTTFYVKNNTNQTVHFKASVLKFSSLGPYEIMNPYTIPPNDSIIARKAPYPREAEGYKWFSKFILVPEEGMEFNNPFKPSNWVKSNDSEGNPVYVFVVTK